MLAPISGNADNLVLTYDSTPEPCGTSLLFIGAIPLLKRRRAIHAALKNNFLLTQGIREV